MATANKKNSALEMAISQVESNLAKGPLLPLQQMLLILRTEPYQLVVYL